jgi:hypothetical protein
MTVVTSFLTKKRIIFALKLISKIPKCAINVKPFIFLLFIASFSHQKCCKYIPPNPIDETNVILFIFNQLYSKLLFPLI